MIRLVCVGDNVVDLHYATGLMYPGGNAVNVSVFARRMGYEAAYAGVLGDDMEAALLRRALCAEDVDISHCVTRHGPTGRSGIRLIDGDRVITEENDGGVVKSQSLQLDESLLAFIRSYDVIHTSHLSYLDDQLAKLHQTGRPVIYDFSTFWNDALFAQVCPHIDVAFLSGAGKDWAALRQVLKGIVRDYGCALSVVTKGGEGAMVFDGNEWYENEPYNFLGGAVDTTGAGDAWLTGFSLTYYQHALLCTGLTAGRDSQVLRSCDIRDYRKRLIPFAMANGNLLARYYCQFHGGFGHGEPMPIDMDKEAKS